MGRELKYYNRVVSSSVDIRCSAGNLPVRYNKLEGLFRSRPILSGFMCLSGVHVADTHVSH